MLAAEELLLRMAAVLRQDIGPAVTDPFPRTQAFMGAVVLDKLSAQLRTAAAHERADRDDRAALAADLETLLVPDDPAELRDAVAALPVGAASTAAEGAEALNRLVLQLYVARPGLGPVRFDRLLSRLRHTLRARLDRQLEVAS